MVKNPLKGYRKKRRIRKFKAKYKYSLSAFTERNKSEATGDDQFLIFGLLVYVGSMIGSNMTGIDWLFSAGTGIFLLCALFPLFYQYWEQFQLAKYTTLTLHIIPRTGDDRRPVKAIIHGCEFGEPLEFHEDVIEFIQEQNCVINHAITSTKNGEAKRTLERAKQLQEDIRIFPVFKKGPGKEEVPFLLPFPDDPDKCLRPASSNVPLTTGVAALRNAELYVLEAEPTKTSISIYEEIIDVDIPLFLPFVTQKAIENWLEESEWFIPTQILTKMAEHTRQKKDAKENEPVFRTLREERDDYYSAYMKLLEDRLVEEDRKRFQEGIVLDIEGIGRDIKQDIASHAIMFLLGFLFCYFLFMR